MKIFIERTKETEEFYFSGRVDELLRKLGFVSEEVLVVKNGELVTEDENLSDEDEVKLLSVVSGG